MSKLGKKVIGTGFVLIQSTLDENVCFSRFFQAGNGLVTPQTIRNRIPSPPHRTKQRVTERPAKSSELENMKPCKISSAIIIVTTAVFVGITCSKAALVTVEAESGMLGSSWAIRTNADVIYITNTSNNTNGFPGTTTRVATYTVTFPEPGTYDLYVRVRIGTGWASDDSFLYGNGFGIKTPSNATDWILCNNLWNVGFTNPTDIVTGAGTVQTTNTWKWINASEFNGGEAPITFTVTEGNLTQTFQIGGREDGLDIDKFVFGTAQDAFTVQQLDFGSNMPPVIEQRDLVVGNLIQFNDNGAWCWFQDERAVVDTQRGKIIVGSVASDNGRGGGPREGDVEVSIFDLATGTSQIYTLKSGDSHPSVFYADDHNAPGLLILPNGHYLAIYAGHNTEKISYWRIFDGTNWTPEQSFDWNSNIPGGADFNTTYSNPHYMAAEGGRIYNFARGHFHGSQNLITSDDLGQTWTYRGVLATNQNVGYVNGYFQFWGNNNDRIDFVCTEYHPDNFNTSIYHGYIMNRMSFRSDGTLVDSVLYDQWAPKSPDFTPVFVAGTVMPPGQTNTRCWSADVVRYDDGIVAVLFTTRVNDRTDNDPDPDHAFFYARWDGNQWSCTYLGKAGKMLYSTQKDYTGLGALSPDDPNTIFISTPIDPRTGTNLTAHEIFKGTTTNHGTTWTWTPVTWKSVRDNLRPIMPKWDKNNRVLLWWRGDYSNPSAAQNFDTAVVGIIERDAELPTKMIFVDANITNTTLADGSLLTRTGPSTNAGPADNMWHERTCVGNGGSVLASAELAGEDAPMLKTTVFVPEPGTYDLWVNFWGKPGADWRIKAGLATNQLHVFRQMACKQVEANDHITPVQITNIAENAYLYQAYVGRVTADTNTAITVFVDDEAIATGTTEPLVGNTVRTWYDGVSYAKVDGFRIRSVMRNLDGLITISWDSVPPERSLTTPRYSVQKKNLLSDSCWITIASGIPSAGAVTTYTDSTTSNSSAFYRVTIP